MVLWMVALLAGYLAASGDVTLMTTTSRVAVVAGLIVSLVVAGFVTACVVTATEAVFPSLRAQRPLYR
jgi:hypothetical protein